MKACKLPSGNYRVQAYYKDEFGVVHRPSFTAPTKAEAMKMALEAEKSARAPISVYDAVSRYIELKKQVLSPSTYRGYEGILRTQIAGSPLSLVSLNELTVAQVQGWVSEISVYLSPKSVQNSYGLLAAALKLYAPDLAIRAKLPQKKRPQLYTPSTSDVNLLLDLSRGTELYKAILLGAVGMMRRGEIAALTAEDLDFKKNTISVTKAQVKTKDGDHVIKAPKTDASYRVIVMPPAVMKAFPKKGPVVDLNASQITSKFQKLVKKSGLPNIRFHDLRHYAASIAASSSIGASVEAIKARGGWSGDSMMKRVYINQIGDEVDKDTKAINSYFSKQISL